MLESVLNKIMKNEINYAKNEILKLYSNKNYDLKSLL